MTIIQITAILSVLMAFGVDAKTVEDIRILLTPVEITTTVPVIQTPIVENQPVYFGSTQPTVYNPPVKETPVVQSPLMNEIQIVEVAQTGKDAKALRPYGSYIFRVAVVVDGKNKKFADVMMEAEGNLDGIITYKTNSESAPKSEDWTAGFEYVPNSPGIKTITFTSEGMTKVHTLTVE